MGSQHVNACCCLADGECCRLDTSKHLVQIGGLLRVKVQAARGRCVLVEVNEQHLFPLLDQGCRRADTAGCLASSTLENGIADDFHRWVFMNSSYAVSGMRQVLAPVGRITPLINPFLTQRVTVARSTLSSLAT